MLERDENGLGCLGLIKTGRNAGQPVGLRSLRVLLLLAASLAVPVARAQSADAAAREYQVKAAFLFNFAKYGEWPGEAFPDAVFRFCIADQPDVVATLNQKLIGQRVHELSIQVLALVAEQLVGCHLLYMTASVPKSRQRALINAAQPLPILLIGESPEFLDSGGAVNFFVSGGTVHFEVNLDNLQKQRLQLSSKLLRHADKVIGKGSIESSADPATKPGGNPP